MNGFEINCFKSGAQRVPLGFLPLPQGAWEIKKVLDAHDYGYEAWAFLVRC
ncbi:hypothetical protein AB2G44_19460 [Escherichia coli]